jgi:hypothetical protein
MNLIHELHLFFRLILTVKDLKYKIDRFIRLLMIYGVWDLITIQ